MPNLRVSLAQVFIQWEDIHGNLRKYDELLKPLSGTTDLVVFPEMFTTGFTMQSHLLAEPVDGETISTILRWAKKYNFAIAGSYIAKEDGNYYNRGFIATPDGNIAFYDKRHLFSISGEDKYFSAGNERLIINYKGWNICLLICYDLRFPVWARNVQNEYDLLLYTANWPASRNHVWNALLPARAIENQCYVCGVNRVGYDGMQLHYTGNSVLIDAKGKCISSIPEGGENIYTYEISKEDLTAFRQKFPVWHDQDIFTIRV